MTISKELLDKWLDQIDHDTINMDVGLDPYMRGFRAGAAHVIDVLTDLIKGEPKKEEMITW